MAMTTRMIPLTQNKFVIVDLEDYEELSKHKWYYDPTNKCAARRDMDTKKIIKMHRVIMNAPKNMEVDHINGNSLDNRKLNMRICYHFQNSKNTKLQKNNTSGYKGITWDKQMNSWRTRINVDGKGILLGLFKDKYEAVMVYEQAANIYFGEFKRRIIA